MQFAFSYMYYMMSEPTGVSRDRYLRDSIDSNKDGAIDSGELRLLAVRIWDTVGKNEWRQIFWKVGGVGTRVRVRC